ncbi:MAG: hydantoinase/oxoprolinase N-terminal domain-containing protein [Gaiellales bacterium]
MNRIGVDVGGTFTDLVLADASGRVHLLKVPGRASCSSWPRSSRPTSASSSTGRRS